MVTVPRGVRHRTSSAVATTGNGSEGQWFTDLINFVNSSYALTTANNSGIPVSHLQWTYWALNVEDGDGLLGTSDTGLAYPTKEYSYLCFNQSGPFAIPPGTGSGQCGSTGSLPAPQ